jgi:hypothetical protein
MSYYPGASGDEPPDNSYMAKLRHLGAEGRLPGAAKREQQIETRPNLRKEDQCEDSLRKRSN